MHKFKQIPDLLLAHRVILGVCYVQRYARSWEEIPRQIDSVTVASIKVGYDVAGDSE
jgi:hypothetical protein